MRQTFKQNWLVYLIILDLAWGISALIYDWPDLAKLPIYIWPLRAICPLYPLLLAIIWWLKYRHKKQNNFIYTWAVLGSAMYGLAALVFYPAMMAAQGFDWLGLGSIPWVLFYGIQGWILLVRPIAKISPISLAIVTILLFTKNYFDWQFATFGYLITKPVSAKITAGLFGAITIFLLICAFVAARSAARFRPPRP